VEVVATFNMKNLPFGLDIGSSTIKAVWLDKGKDGYILKAAATVETPEKGMLSESPFDQEEISQTIKNLVHEAKIDSPLVSVALPENQVYTRVIEMPTLSDKELSSAIYWEAEQYIPVPLPTLTLDWKVLTRPKNPQEGVTMTVLLVGAPTQLLDKYDKILSQASLRVVSAETEILSVVRALTFVGKKSSVLFPNTVIVHIGSISTSLAILKENSIVFTYTIPTGGTAISRAISTDFGFSSTQAEEYKKTYGVTKESLEGKIGQATAPVLSSIVSEIKKAVAFYTNKYKNAVPVAQILLSGGSAKLPGISGFFAENAGIETVIANPWHVLASQDMPKELLDNAPEYTIGIGLSMRVYE